MTTLFVFFNLHLVSFQNPPVMDPRLGDPTEEEEGCQQREAMPMPGGWEKPDFFMGQVG